MIKVKIDCVDKISDQLRIPVMSVKILKGIFLPTILLVIRLPTM